MATARKPASAKVKVVVRTDALFVDGEHYHYGSTVTLPADRAKWLVDRKMAEKL